MSSPLLRTWISSAHAYARSTSWVEMTTVVPLWWSCSASSITSRAICGSRPAVGSSMTRTSGSIASAPASASLFLCP